jgi:hypothetical protein
MRVPATRRQLEASPLLGCIREKARWLFVEAELSQCHRAEIRHVADAALCQLNDFLGDKPVAGSSVVFNPSASHTLSKASDISRIASGSNA